MTQGLPKITVATVTYNRATMLPKAIESVLGQTFSDFEYIIIDNGSTDDTPDVAGRYRRQDSRIKLYSFPGNNIDASSMYERWRIFAQSKTAEYISHVDDDDFIEPKMLETLYGLITEYGADMASAGSKFIYPDGTTKDKYVFDGTYIYSRLEAMTELLKREKFNAAKGGKLFRKSVYQNQVLPEVKVVRDIYYSYRIMERINRMAVTGEPLYFFYRHDSNLSGLDTAEQITPNRMRQHLEANSIRTDWLAERMPEIKDFAFYCELSFMISLYERIHRLGAASCLGIAEEMKAALRRHGEFLSRSPHRTERAAGILNEMGI